MTAWIDSTIDELEAHLRRLKRDVSTLETFLRQVQDPVPTDAHGPSERGRLDDDLGPER